MFEIEFYLNENEAVLELAVEHLAKNTAIHLHNDARFPTNIIFLNCPIATNLEASTATSWHSIIKLDSKEPVDLVIAINNNTYISQGDFISFQSVLITDSKISLKHSGYPTLEDNNTNSRLEIDHFKASKAYIKCASLSLLNAGKISDVLAVNLQNIQGAKELKLEGVRENQKQDHLIINKLKLHSEIDDLFLYKVLINQKSVLSNVKSSHINNCLAQDEIILKSYEKTSLSLKTLAHSGKIYSDEIVIEKLIFPRGKFYIAANSYINFKTTINGQLQGLELVLDMSKSLNSNKKIVFPTVKFHFDSMDIKGADEVSILVGGTCRQLLFEECTNVAIYGLIAHNIKYEVNQNPGRVALSGSEVRENLTILGDVAGIFNNNILNNLEGSSLCSFNFTGSGEYKTLKLNLNLDAANTRNDIASKRGDSLNIRIINDAARKIEFGTILAKLSVFYLKGNIKLGTVLIQPIDKIATLFWVDISTNTKLRLDKLFIGFDHDLVINKDGTINVIKTDKMLLGSNIYASMGASILENSIYIKAGKAIRFSGAVEIIDGDIGLFANAENILFNAKLKNNNRKFTAAAHEGSVNIVNSDIDSSVTALYSREGNYILDSAVKAQELLAYTTKGHIQINMANIVSNKIALIAQGNVESLSSNVIAGSIGINSNTNTNIINSNILAHDIYTISVSNFLLAGSNITLRDNPYLLFANDIKPLASNASNSDTNIICKGGFKVSDNLNIIGLLSNDATKNLIFPQLKWQAVNCKEEFSLDCNICYIEANKGYIAGSALNSSDSVIIKTAHSLEAVPLTLYNEVIDAGGFKLEIIEEVVSKINSGIIDIEANYAVNFVGALLKASAGSISAGVINMLRSPAEIKASQDKIKALTNWSSALYKEPEQFDVGKYLNFSKATSIKQRIANLSIYDNYVSSDLSFTQLEGDIEINRPITKYEKLHINAKEGKILLVSKNLHNIYPTLEDRIKGKIKNKDIDQLALRKEKTYQTALEARVRIEAEHVYLEANSIIMKGSKIEASGSLNVITSGGIYTLPIAVHERLMYHQGSRTKIKESTVRQVISEINAGYIDIKAGGVMEAVSTLIKATGINLDVESLKLGAEYEIFEKNVYYKGKRKWWGGRNFKKDLSHDELVLPTVIDTTSLYANINCDTTIEAAQILTKEEALMKAGGNISLLNKKNIYIHDSVSKKAHLFKFKGGSLSIYGSKTIKEHYRGQAPAPTIYYCAGSFFGYSEGKIHLLGAKIIGEDIYLLGQKGVKIEAAPYTQEQLITISEQGLRLGFSASKAGISAAAEIFKNSERIHLTKLLYEASEIAAQNKLFIESNGKLIVTSSKLKFKQASIKVRELLVNTYQEHQQVEQKQSKASIGIYAGVSHILQEPALKIMDRAGYLLHKNGSHLLDILDRGLNGYSLYKELRDIKNHLSNLTNHGNIKNIFDLKAVKFGVWVGASYQEQSVNQKQSISLDNEITGGKLDIYVNDKAIIEGIYCQVEEFKLKAKKLDIITSTDHTISKTYNANLNLTIPIKGNASFGIGASGSKSSSAATLHHKDNMIIAGGNLEVTVEEDIKISGVKFVANQVLIKVNNLIIESVQDIVQERMRGLGVNLGFDKASGFNIGVNAENFQRDINWTNAIGGIIGTQLVSIALQQTLEITGGLIANAKLDEQGLITTEGKLEIEAAKIIAKRLHDYDKGESFGLGLVLNQNNHTDQNGGLKYGIDIPVTCNFEKNTRDILPTITKDFITGIIDRELEDSIDGAKIIEGAINNRLDKHIGNTRSKKVGLDANIPVGDFIEFIQTKLKPEQETVWQDTNNEEEYYKQSDQVTIPEEQNSNNVSTAEENVVTNEPITQEDLDSIHKYMIENLSSDITGYPEFESIGLTNQENNSPEQINVLATIPLDVAIEKFFEAKSNKVKIEEIRIRGALPADNLVDKLDNQIAEILPVLADNIIEYTKAYEGLKANYPKTVYIVEKAAVIGLQAITGIGLIKAVAQEVVAEGMHAATSELTTPLFADLAEKGALKLQEKYPNLTHEQAISLIAASMVTIFLIKDGTKALYNFSKVINKAGSRQLTKLGTANKSKDHTLGLNTKEQPLNNHPSHNTLDFENYLKNLKSGDKIDGKKIIYKDASYHHINSQNHKSPAPKNPTIALENAYVVNPDAKSRQLIGVDLENKQIVVFYKSHGNEYHGFVTTPGDLLAEQKTTHKTVLKKLVQNLSTELTTLSNASSSSKKMLESQIDYLHEINKQLKK